MPVDDKAEALEGPFDWVEAFRQFPRHQVDDEDSDTRRTGELFVLSP